MNRLFKHLYLWIVVYALAFILNILIIGIGTKGYLWPLAGVLSIIVLTIAVWMINRWIDVDKTEEKTTVEIRPPQKKK